MAAGPATPDHHLNSPCFRLIQQLLPTFGERSFWADRKTLRCAVSMQFAYHPTGAQLPQNTRDMRFECDHANRQCSPLHKISPVARKQDGARKICINPPLNPICLNRPSRAVRCQASQMVVTNVTPRTCHSPENQSLVLSLWLRGNAACSFRRPLFGTGLRFWQAQSAASSQECKIRFCPASPF